MVSMSLYHKIDLKNHNTASRTLKTMNTTTMMKSWDYTPKNKNNSYQRFAGFFLQFQFTTQIQIKVVKCCLFTVEQSAKKPDTTESENKRN